MQRKKLVSAEKEGKRWKGGGELGNQEEGLLCEELAVLQLG